MKMDWKPWRIALAIGLALPFFAVSPRLHAQLELITFDYPFQAQKLAGIAVDPSGSSVMGVLIEDCDATFKRVRASTRTDENGHFALHGSRLGGTHYLRVSKDGFDPMQMTVDLKPGASAELTIQLHVAT
jgi:hypothetical protein